MALFAALLTSLLLPATGLAVDREAITSYDQMRGGAPHHGYFDVAWQPFAAQSSVLTHVGVTVGTPSLLAGSAVGFTVHVRLCDAQPDAQGNCHSLADVNPQIINYGNTYTDIGDIAVNRGGTYWVIWFQPAAANGGSWVTYWWTGGSSISASDTMQLVVKGYDPGAPPPSPVTTNPPAPDAGTPTTSAPTSSAPSVPAPARYAVANVASVNLRAGPGTGFARTGTLAGGSAIGIVCQTVGENVNGSSIWDRLDSGSYISDWYTTTPVVGDYTPGIPHCDGAPGQVHPATATGRWSVVAGAAVNVRVGPGVGYDAVGSLAPGGRFDIVCQTYGSVVFGSPVWDMIGDGRYVADYYTDTPVFAAFSPGLDTCPGTGPPPAAPPATPAAGTPSGSTDHVEAGSAADCHADIMVIGARGSGEPDGFGKTTWQAAGPVMRRFDDRVRLDGLDGRYPAMAIVSLTTLTNFGLYRDSVAAGTTAILTGMRYQRTAWRNHGCTKKLHFLLIGYSQGAWAIGDAILQMSADERRQIDGVALFGDPRNHGSLFRHGIWDRGHVFPDDIRTRIRNVCRSGDPVCDFDGSFKHAAATVTEHFGYKRDFGEAYDAGVWLADQLGRG